MAPRRKAVLGDYPAPFNKGCAGLSDEFKAAAVEALSLQDTRKTEHGFLVCKNPSSSLLEPCGHLCEGTRCMVDMSNAPSIERTAVSSFHTHPDHPAQSSNDQDSDGHFGHPVSYLGWRQDDKYEVLIVPVETPARDGVPPIAKCILGDAKPMPKKFGWDLSPGPGHERDLAMKAEEYRSKMDDARKKVTMTSSDTVLEDAILSEAIATCMQQAEDVPFDMIGSVDRAEKICLHDARDKLEQIKKDPSFAKNLKSFQRDIADLNRGIDKRFPSNTKSVPLA